MSLVRTSFTRGDIAKILPHQPPFLLLEEVTGIVPGLGGSGRKRLSPGDWYFQGHFPGNPIMPGVLIVECLAQLSAVIYASEFLKDDLSAFAARVGDLAKTEIKFHAPVRPPAILDLDARMVRKVGRLFRFQVKATVAGSVAADGVINVSENPEE